MFGTRYFFNFVDGRPITDNASHEFATLEEATREAVRYAGDLMRDDPAEILSAKQFTVTLSDVSGEALFRVRIRAENALDD